MKLSLASTEAPSKVKAAIEGVEKISDQINEILLNCGSLEELLEEELKEDCKIEGIQETVDNIGELEKILCYLNIVKSVEDISEKLEYYLISNDDDSIIKFYKKLVGMKMNLRHSNCHNIVNYINDTLHFWHNHLKDKYSNEYNDVLKALKWPFCGTNITILNTPSTDSMARFKIVTEYLFQLQLPYPFFFYRKENSIKEFTS